MMGTLNFLLYDYLYSPRFLHQMYVVCVIFEVSKMERGAAAAFFVMGFKWQYLKNQRVGEK